MRIQVGARLQLMLERNRQSLYYSSLIGYVAGEYLLVKLPIEHGLSVPMQEGERVIVRVFSGVAVYAFACSIESVLLAPRYYMHPSLYAPELSEGDTGNAAAGSGARESQPACTGPAHAVRA